MFLANVSAIILRNSPLNETSIFLILLYVIHYTTLMRYIFIPANSSIMYKQSLKANNKNLAKALDLSKQDTAALARKVLELEQEKQVYESIMLHHCFHQINIITFKSPTKKLALTLTFNNEAVVALIMF